MAANEFDRVSYVRVLHEVKPSPELRPFLARVSGIAIEELGYSGSTMMSEKTATSSDDLMRFEPTLRVVGISRADLYPLTGLRTVAFERTLPRSQRANKSLRRLEARLSNADISDSDIEPKILRGCAEYMIESTRPEHRNVREFALEFAKDGLQAYLRAEHEALYEHSGIKSNSKLSEQNYGTFIDPTVLPLLTIPSDTDGHAVDRFMDAVNEMIMEYAMYGQGLEVELEDREIVTRLR
jgi:hypothetical protein